METEDEYQGYYADCYVLSSDRTEKIVQEFLNHFAPLRSESADYFEVPQYAENPTIVFEKSSEIVKYLTDNKAVKHTVYWKNQEKSDLRGVQLFFTDDGYIIFGVYCETKYPNTEIEDKFLSELKEFCASEEGYIAYETPAPHNSDEFRELLKTL